MIVLEYLRHGNTTTTNTTTTSYSTTTNTNTNKVFESSYYTRFTNIGEVELCVRRMDHSGL